MPLISSLAFLRSYPPISNRANSTLRGSAQIAQAGGDWKEAYKGEKNSSPLLIDKISQALGKLPPLSNFGYGSQLPEEQGVLASSEYFDIQVDYAPRKFRPGYVFRVTLVPHTDITFKRMRQNCYFLIDRSNSIPRTRYILNKEAVCEALTYLKPKDRFNILIFDHRLLRFQEDAVEWSPERIKAAQEFLRNQGHGGIFAATELYASLGKIIPAEVAENN